MNLIPLIFQIESRTHIHPKYREMNIKKEKKKDNITIQNQIHLQQTKIKKEKERDNRKN